MPSKDTAMNTISVLFSRLGLQYKFILITTCSIIAAMGIVGYLAVEREKNILYVEAEKQGRLLGETLAIPIINDLIYEKLGIVEEGGLLDNYIMEIFSRQDIALLYIAVLNEAGKVMSHNNITEYGKVYTDQLTRRALASDSTIVQQIDNNTLDFGVPLSIGKKKWGVLRFGLSLEKVEREILVTIKRIVILTMALLFAGFVIIMLLSKRFISPIIHLANTMEKARGDYLDISVDVKGHDELAILGKRFNSMIERLRQANEDLKKTHEKLIRSEKLASIGILAAGVAHEINNPLGGIFNCIEMLRHNGGNAELREKYLALVNEGLDRIGNTVNKLLWMSQRPDHSPVSVNIRDTMDSVYSFLEYKIQKRGIAFINEVPDDLQVTFDIHDFQQLILNLFINSIHAMVNGGTLEVCGHREGSSVSIEVADTGCGIAAENIGRIFDPFFTTKPTGEGTGLGLWLTYEIIRNYNGEISVESEFGKGSRFIMRFPVTESI
ncbi:MAG: HAMP domain-containing protein [Nitrospirae bacterium]|nr:HAMP domain-containing protein [Nitrospirota bacterium]MBF0534569.1 HAMP domain-containing protein [Nitrospirota bacterium]MBF0617604.1 HAMP domain-containing protein [Nitrospirota bacterium]